MTLAQWSQPDMFSAAGPKFNWNDESIDRLKQMVADKFSAAQIAAEFGVTRNSILGKIHRLGIVMPNRLGSVGRPKKPREPKLHWTGLPKRKSPRRKPPTIPDGYQCAPIECIPLNIKFLDVTDNQCSYVIGEVNGVETVCCGLAVIADRSYCQSHYSMCHTVTSGPRPSYTYNLRKTRPTKQVLQSDAIEPINPDEVAA